MRWPPPCPSQNETNSILLPEAVRRDMFGLYCELRRHHSRLEYGQAALP